VYSEYKQQQMIASNTNTSSNNMAVTTNSAESNTSTETNVNNNDSSKITPLVSAPALTSQEKFIKSIREVKVKFEKFKVIIFPTYVILG
jgi:hypothetical protein